MENMMPSSYMDLESMQLDQQKCRHTSLFFGSGDYYVMCKDCDRTWVKVALGEDKADPEYVNNDITGEERHELTLDTVRVAINEKK